jgi:hypothetical protein
MGMQTGRQTDSFAKAPKNEKEETDKNPRY